MRFIVFSSGVPAAGTDDGDDGAAKYPETDERRTTNNNTNNNYNNNNAAYNTIIVLNTTTIIIGVPPSDFTKPRGRIFFFLSFFLSVTRTVFFPPPRFSPYTEDNIINYIYPIFSPPPPHTNNILIRRSGHANGTKCSSCTIQIRNSFCPVNSAVIVFGPE